MPFFDLREHGSAVLIYETTTLGDNTGGTLIRDFKRTNIHYDLSALYDKNQLSIHQKQQFGTIDNRFSYKYSFITNEGVSFNREQWVNYFATLGNTSGVLSSEQSNVLSHLTYVPAETSPPFPEHILCDILFSASVSSLSLGNHHVISSNAENVGFKNISTNIEYYPMWGGLKDQKEGSTETSPQTLVVHSSLVNRDLDGAINPSGRVYDKLISSAQGFSLTTTLVNWDNVLSAGMQGSIPSQSAFSIEFYPDPSIDFSGCTFRYRCYYGTGKTNLVWEDQVVEGTSSLVPVVNAGIDGFRMWFSHRFDLHFNGEFDYNFEMTYLPVGGINYLPLDVCSDGLGTNYAYVYSRQYSDIPLCLDSNISFDEDLTVFHGGVYVAELTQSRTLTISPLIDSFIVKDTDTLNNNTRVLTIDFGATQILMKQNFKKKGIHCHRFGNVWKVYKHTNEFLGEYSII